MVICLERGAGLHMAQLMPLPLTVSCFSKVEIGFTFLVLAHQGSPGQRAIKRVCVCVSGEPPRKGFLTKMPFPSPIYGAKIGRVSTQKPRKQSA